MARRGLRKAESTLLFYANIEFQLLQIILIERSLWYGR